MSELDIARGGITVDPSLAELIENEVLPYTKIEPEAFWTGLTDLIDQMTPGNRALLARRVELQSAIDSWHAGRAGQPIDPGEYREFLVELGYLVPTGPAFQIDTDNVDPEIAVIAGPQLVVPVTNARYALNAANARWGSLYDALYGTDALGDRPPPGPYDATRGARVVAWARSLLDDVVPLATGSHAEAVKYRVADATLAVDQSDGSCSALADTGLFAGYSGSPDAPTSIFLRHHGLVIELIIDASTAVGSADRAGIADIALESAITTIVDFEDSVAAVDGADKAAAYRNWLGLTTRELTETVTKGDRSFTRTLNPDRSITAPDGSTRTLRGTALLLARNVGHLMTTPAVHDRDGAEVFEGLLDAMVTVLIASCSGGKESSNSRTGSVYVVKPKMHGPDEVAFAADVFTRVEQILRLPENTVKIGIMDEERRTTVNLAECIRAARSRVAFINTGFLDRTGDEIHTSMQAGPMVRKAEMKAQPWISAYEDWNVDAGIAAGLLGRAQIGKGMWAAPDLMADMLAQKISHPLAGASCAWVPSPTAATLHATHYHRVDVAARQRELAAGPRRAELSSLLTIPLAIDSAWSRDDIQAEVDNNVQGILGYVVRWVDQGVGCSKVPDLHDVGLMEDRATCRISSQHVANWLAHGVITPDLVDDSLRRMATKVDGQNAGDAHYVPMAPGFDGSAFRAARALIFEGESQPSGYTEPLLHAFRREAKALAVGGGSQ